MSLEEKFDLEAEEKKEWSSLDVEDEIINPPVIETSSFGISYLDESLRGIEKTDLIILGGKSGRGKTQACTLMALDSIRRKKNVYMFALEAEGKEIQKRIFYHLTERVLFRRLDKDVLSTFNFNYADWRQGKYRTIINEHVGEIKEIIEPYKQYLNVYYKGVHFDQQTLKNKVMNLKGKADLIILDHLNYIDIPGVKENKEIDEIMQAVRDLTLINEIPIIVVAHCRKSGNQDKSLVPGIEDFMGSSNIFKNAVKCVMIAPYEDKDIQKERYQFPTLIHVGKFRHDVCYKIRWGL